MFVPRGQQDKIVNKTRHKLKQHIFWQDKIKYKISVAITLPDHNVNNEIRQDKRDEKVKTYNKAGQNKRKCNVCNGVCLKVLSYRV